MADRALWCVRDKRPDTITPFREQQHQEKFWMLYSVCRTWCAERTIFDPDMNVRMGLIDSRFPRDGRVLVTTGFVGFQGPCQHRPPH